MSERAGGRADGHVGEIISQVTRGCSPCIMYVCIPYGYYLLLIGRNGLGMRLRLVSEKCHVFRVKEVDANTSNNIRNFHLKTQGHPSLWTEAGRGVVFETDLRGIPCKSATPPPPPKGPPGNTEVFVCMQYD